MQWFDLESPISDTFQSLGPLWTTETGSMWRECIRKKKKEKDPMFHEHWQQLRSKSNSPPSKSFREGESSAAQTMYTCGARLYLHSRLILAPQPYHWLYSPPVDVVSSIALWKGLLLAFGRFVRSFYERRFSL